MQFHFTPPDPNRWSDGLPVHDLVLYVRLSCGHERVSRGWRGEEGTAYCCDVCKTLQTMEQISLTDEPVCRWRIARDF